MSINNWFLVVSEWAKNLFNLNKEKDMEALRLLEKVLSDAKLKFEEPLKVQAINIFFWAKRDGEANKYAIEQALLCASGENLKLYEKARRIYKALSLKLDRPKKTVKRSTRLVHKHVIKKNDKPKPEKKSKNIASETPNRDNKWRLGTRILIIALLLLLVIVVIIVSCKTQPAAVIVNVNETTTTTAVATSTTIAPAVTTWKMVQGDYGNNRWFSDGIAEIKNAKTDKDAVNASYVWLDKVKRDPNLLVAVAKYFLAKDVDKATLVDKDNWATDKAVQLVAELELVLGQAKVSLQEAPKNGYNTGVDSGQVVQAKKAVITGDRSGIRIDITLLDGKVVSFWIMARCGNIVTKEKPSLPIGKTDNVITVTTTTAPPETTTTLAPVTTTTAPPETTTTLAPVTTTTAPPETTTTLAPKSDDPIDYPSPGKDNTTDSGTGDKPTVTTVTTPPESTPAVVITIEVVNDVTETPTNDPGSETGVDASGSTPTETTSTPTTEAGVNPPNNGTNTGDSGSPF